MSLRIGGYAAIVGGLLWLVSLAGNAINDGGESPLFLGYAIVGATVMTLVALIGLSAFQARSHPALTWAAFAIPAFGAMVGLAGIVAVVVTDDSDAALVGGLSPWMIGSIGLLTMILGSSLFAVATWRARSLSRTASALLAIGALLVVAALFGASGALPSPIVMVPVMAAIIVFPAGWIAMGVSALRIDRAGTMHLEGAIS